MSDKIKLTDIASEAGKSTKEVLNACTLLGFSAKSVQGSVTIEQAEVLFQYLLNGELPKPPAPKSSQSNGKSPKAPVPQGVKHGEPVESAAPAQTAQPAGSAAPEPAGAAAPAPAKKVVNEAVKESAAPAATPQVTPAVSFTPIATTVTPAQVKPHAPQTAHATAQSKPPFKSDHKPEAAMPTAPNVHATHAAHAPHTPEIKPLEKARVKSGLRIVNKKQPVFAPTSDRPISSDTSGNYGRNKVAADLASEEHRRKKEKKAVVVIGKKEQGKRLELLRDRDLNTPDRYEDEMVMMPDLSIGVSDFLAEQERKERNAKKDYEKAKTLSSATGRMVGDVSIARVKRRKSSHNKIQRENETREQVSVIEIAEDVRVYEFADKISQPIAAVIKKLLELGMLVTKNDFLGKDAIEILAEEFKVEVKTKDVSEELDYVAEYDAANTSKHKTDTRAPIVTVMGHVDHGKTSLLDYIRSSRVASSEAGGITQHIGAYTVTKNHKAITFIDTPGHEAFSQMRARGANATDIVIIVVAADDGVMPQTKEAISHAKAAKCPIVVAINKVDKPGANIDRVKGELAEAGLTALDWGGDTECVSVSAKTGAGVENLLETILLQAELMDLRARNDAPAKAVVLESSLEKGRGTVITVIVQNGTLRVGDSVVAGVSSGRIRAIKNDCGEVITELKSSEAGEIVGLDLVPSSGDILIAVDDIESAKAFAAKRSEYERARALSRSTKATLDDLGELIAEGKLKRLKIVLKADVQGTLEAIVSSLLKLRNNEVKADIIHSAVGAISESDVALAAASEHTIIMGFHVKPSQIIKEKARVLGVRISSYDVIYDLIEDVRKALSGMLSKITEEQIAGKAEVRQVFDIPKLGRIAGCMVLDGEVIKGFTARVLRGETELYKGKIETLKRFKDDVKEVKKGLECGIGLAGFNGVEAGDSIEIYRSIEVDATFEA